MTTSLLSLNIPDDKWESLSSDRSLLRCTITICGCDMHLEAHAVSWSDPGGNTYDTQPDDATATQNDGGSFSEYEALHAAHGLQSPQQEVTIAGGQYVLFASAHS